MPDSPGFLPQRRIPEISDLIHIELNFCFQQFFFYNNLRACVLTLVMLALSSQLIFLEIFHFGKIHVIYSEYQGLNTETFGDKTLEALRLSAHR